MNYRKQRTNCHSSLCFYANVCIYLRLIHFVLVWKTLRKDKSVRLDEINMRSTCFIYHLGSNVLAISNWLEPCIRKLGQWYDSLAGLLVCSSLKADYNWERQKVCACVCVSTIQRCGKLIQKSKWAMLLKLRYSLKCKTGHLICMGLYLITHFDIVVTETC